MTNLLVDVNQGIMMMIQMLIAKIVLTNVQPVQEQQTVVILVKEIELTLIVTAQLDNMMIIPALIVKIVIIIVESVLVLEWQLVHNVLEVSEKV